MVCAPEYTLYHIIRSVFAGNSLSLPLWKIKEIMKYDITISGTIGSWDSLSTDYVQYYLGQHKDKDVHVAFCSLGGYVMDGLVLNQLFKDHGKVHAHAFGMNASIATIAMLGCQDIDIVKGSFFLIHNVSTFISAYSQKNKESLDEYIKTLTKQRNDLATFDDVLAQMYADKTGKTKEECAEQMTKGSWLTAQQAIDFGLVDSIREDQEDEGKAQNFVNKFTNLYKIENNIREAGIPPLPSVQEQPSLAAVVDDKGNPTPTFLQKALLGVKNLLHKDTNAEDNNQQMSKPVYALMAALCANALVVDDKGQVTLSAEQAKTVEDRLAELEKKDKDSTAAMNAAVPAIDKLKAKLNDLEKDVKAKDEQIKNMQTAPGAVTDQGPKKEGQEASFTPEDIWNCIKDI